MSSPSFTSSSQSAWICDCMQFATGETLGRRWRFPQGCGLGLLLGPRLGGVRREEGLAVSAPGRSAHQTNGN
jgi:hypothetical protein